jgi:hypothetical protein
MKTQLGGGALWGRKPGDRRGTRRRDWEAGVEAAALGRSGVARPSQGRPGQAGDRGVFASGDRGHGTLDSGAAAHGRSRLCKSPAVPAKMGESVLRSKYQELTRLRLLSTEEWIHYPNEI